MHLDPARCEEMLSHASEHDALSGAQLLSQDNMGDK